MNQVANFNQKLFELLFDDFNLRRIDNILTKIRVKHDSNNILFQNRSENLQGKKTWFF